jgi:three-Cys-motif partner protein
MSPRRRKSKKDAKENILLHTEAKLALYEKYVNKYLAILSVTGYVSKINIYDVFCGTGIYKDGKKGSPLLAFECIRQNREFCETHGWKPKPIFLSVNDGAPTHVEKVRSHLTKINTGICNISFSELSAEKMFKNVIQEIQNQKSSERNLIFIDPYGYKEIHKDDLWFLLANKRTEIMLFLPISFMYRFKTEALIDFEKPGYKRLRKFIYEFFDENHPIRKKQKIDVFDFIRNLKEAFSFSDEFYTSSFYLQRDFANYYALFFMTPNFMGLEKIVEENWRLNPNAGLGFDLPSSSSNQTSIFDIIEYPQENIKFSKRMADLEDIIVEAITGQHEVTNERLTTLIVIKGFLPKHAKMILSKFQQEKRLDVYHWPSEKKARKGSFYLGHSNFSKKDKLVIFKLIG